MKNNHPGSASAKNRPRIGSQWRRPSITAYLTLCISGLALCGCHHGFQPHSLSFKTLIAADNIKRFELSVLPKPIDPLSSFNRNQASNANNIDTLQPNRSEKYLQDILEDTLAKNHYCRDGYLLLGRFAGENLYRLRGECKDTATPQDKQQFPDTIERW